MAAQSVRAHMASVTLARAHDRVSHGCAVRSTEVGPHDRRHLLQCRVHRALGIRSSVTAGCTLVGTRDGAAGALSLGHRRPSTCADRTAAELATRVGASHSVIAERFARFLGEPLQAYLARWRLQLAARLLAITRKTIVQVAGEVGHESEPAFNRAFKREFGLPPARYRKQLAAVDGTKHAAASSSYVHAESNRDV